MDGLAVGAGRRGLWRTGAASAALAMVAGLSVHALAPIGTLSAAQRGGPLGPDSDADGLPNSLELVRGTSPELADTDGDGFEDAMEMAMGSDPRDGGSTPESYEHTLGLVPFVHKGTFHLTQLLFAPAGDVAGVSYALSLYGQGTITPLGPDAYLANATLHAVGSGPRGDLVVLLTTSVPVGVIEQLGQHSFLAVAAAPGAHKPTTSAGVTLTLIDGVMHEVVEASQVGSSGGGHAYLPLTVDLPDSFTPGQICLQTSVAVGTSGPMVVFEVDDSDCIAADAHCSSSSCAGQTGSTFEMLDPLALIGG